MSKIVKEDCHAISIYKFKEWQILDHGWYSGQITWTRQIDQHQNSISYTWVKSEQLLKLDYTITRPDDKVSREIHQEIGLEAQSCFYGGQRFFFRCPVYKSNQYCGRRVAKLYLAPWNDYFACRHCYGLTYRSRIDGWTYYLGDADEYAKKIKHWYYAGKPTKKHLRYNKISSAINEEMLELMCRFQKRSLR